MTFPLGSLRSDTGGTSASSAAAQGGTYTRSNSAPGTAGAAHHPHWKLQLKLLAGGVLWLLALLAMPTHNAADPALGDTVAASFCAPMVGGVTSPGHQGIRGGQ